MHVVFCLCVMFSTEEPIDYISENDFFKQEGDISISGVRLQAYLKVMNLEPGLNKIV